MIELAAAQLLISALSAAVGLGILCLGNSAPGRLTAAGLLLLAAVVAWHGIH